MIIERASSCLPTSLYGCIFHKIFIHYHRQENLKSRGFVSPPRLSPPNSFWSIESFTQKTSWTSCHYCERLSCGTFRYVSWTPSLKKSIVSRTSGLKHDIQNRFPRICRVGICENFKFIFCSYGIVISRYTHYKYVIRRRNTLAKINIETKYQRPIVILSHCF